MLSYEVKINVLQSPMGSLLAFADVIVADRMKITGFKVFKNRDGDLFVAAPSQATKKTTPEGKPEYIDTVWFVDPKADEDSKRTPFQEELYGVILDEFRKTQGGAKPKTPVKSSPSTGPARAPRANPLWDRS